MTQPPLGLPGEIDDDLRLTFKPGLQRFPDACREAVGPGNFDQDTPCMDVTGFGQLTELFGLATGVL